MCQTIKLGFLLLAILACNAETQKTFSKASDQELSEDEKAQLESIVAEQLEKRDENGTVNDIQGLDKNEKFSSLSEQLDSNDFRELAQRDEQVFEFEPPEGIQAEFSEPVMISGASLALTADRDDLKLICESLRFSTEEPTMKDIISRAKRTNACGNLTINFCIRLKMAKQILEDSPNFTYTQSPNFSVKLPCAQDSFEGLNIEIAGGATHTNNATEKVKIEGSRALISVYLTNTPGCIEGGEWKNIQRDDPEWSLDFIDNTATVYAKFKDVFESESECISDSISYGSTKDQCFANEPGFKAENIISGVSIGDIQGTASPSFPICTSDGQTNCIATDTHKAVTAVNVSAKVMESKTVAGISGTRAEVSDSCSTDGEIECAANTTYPAALATGLAAKLVTGNTVAGVAGAALAETRSDCSSDGEAGCIATSAYPATLIAGLGPKITSGNTVAGVSGSGVPAKANCSSDGETDCAANATYAAALTTGLGPKIISGNTVAGVAGSATEESRANCSSDGQTSCITTATYTAALTTSLAAKVVTGNMVAGVAGSAIEQKANCSSDGGTDCAATATYAAALTTGLGPKIISGNTVAGVAGSATEESNPDCSAGNQTSCVATTTYKTMDLTNKDAGGALDLTDSNFETRVASASTFEYWDENGMRHTNAGDGDLLASNIDTGTNIFGVDGTAVAPDCSSIPFGIWILVPGDPDYGTNDFCVMKYEAKCSLADGSTCTASASTESPTSTAANTPWVSINQQDAITECASLGKGYHLITNDEWMAIATNVAAVASNWSNGVVGDAQLKRGHSDNSPSQACAASSDDSLNVVESDCTAQASANDDFIEQRTHTLSNGEVIWDLAGNVTEWTSYFNDEEKPTPAATGWRQLSAFTGTATMPGSDIVPMLATSNSWTSSNSIGMFLTGIDSSGGALIRGGSYNYGQWAGVFNGTLNKGPTEFNNDRGFRCAVAVP